MFASKSEVRSPGYQVWIQRLVVRKQKLRVRKKGSQEAQELAMRSYESFGSSSR